MELYEVYSGKEFKELNPGVKFYKILSEDLKHHGFQYKLGENIDILPFNPTYECTSGGLYFASLDHIFEYLVFGTKIGMIEIPDHALIYIENAKYKADQFTLAKIISVSKFINSSEKMCEIAIRQNGLALKYIKNQSTKLCELAVKQDGHALVFVKDQTIKICKLAVKQNPFVLSFVRDQDEEICKIAVKRNSNAACYVKTRSEEIERICRGGFSSEDSDSSSHEEN